MSVETIQVRTVLVSQDGAQIGQFTGIDFQGSSFDVSDGGPSIQVRTASGFGVPAAPDQSFQINDSGVFGPADGIENDAVNLRPKLTNDIEWEDSGNLGVLVWNPTAARTLTLPNATDTLVGKATVDTLTNKSIDADANTITNIENADIKAAAAIAGTKIDPDFGAQNVTTTGAYRGGPAGVGYATEARFRLGDGSKEIIGSRNAGNTDNLIAVSATDTVLNIGTDTGYNSGKTYSTTVVAGSSSVIIGSNTTTHALITSTGVAVYNTRNLMLYGNGIMAPDLGGGAGVFAIGNADTAPTSTPSGGGVLYVEGGALKYIGSSGTVTTIAAA